MQYNRYDLESYASPTRMSLIKTKDLVYLANQGLVLQSSHVVQFSGEPKKILLALAWASQQMHPAALFCLLKGLLTNERFANVLSAEAGQGAVVLLRHSKCSICKSI